VAHFYLPCLNGEGYKNSQKSIHTYYTLPMNRSDWLVIFLAYIAGLLATSIFAFAETIISWYWIAIVVFSFCLAGIIGYLIIPKFYYRIRDIVWLLASFTAAVAIIYFWLQIPQPQTDDISQFSKMNNSQVVTVSGTVIESPKLTRNDRLQLWLKVDLFEDDRKKIEAATGKLYVTIPQIKDLEIYPHLKLSIKGVLSVPKAPKDSRSFNFKYYLKQQNSFAVLNGKEVYVTEKQQKPQFSWWQVRQKIVRSQQAFLGNTKGQLLSSMVLGSKAVDLSYDLRDRFTKVGLAHVFAASGFQVSLLLGLVLRLTQKYSQKSQLIIGSIVLLSYLCLTGVQPSIARATIMGIGVLIATVSERKIRSLGALLAAAILLLIINPLWIWDLGFQLSFLATLGLIVTVPYLTQKMDWLPPTIADLIAIPVASFLWTTPLILYVFKTISLICIPVNIITALLVTIISLGGTISAVFALIIPFLGSTIAYLFYYPIELFLWLVNWFADIPFSQFAIGQISLLALIILYSLFVIVWTIDFWQKRWVYVGIFGLCLVFIPNIYRYFNFQQITVLVNDRQPTIIIQDRGKIGSIARGNPETARYSILPFLTGEGINHIDYGITLNPESEDKAMWSYITDRLTVKKLFSNTNSTILDTANIEYIDRDRTLSLGSISLNILETQPVILYLRFDSTKILFLADSKDYISLNNLNLPIDTIVLANAKISNNLIAKIKPKTIINTAKKISIEQQKNLQQQLIEPLSLEGDDILQWLPQQGWQTATANRGDN
jgi:competence protein ComEC